jgi:hypothetical protein
VIAGLGLVAWATLVAARTWRPIDRPLAFDEPADWAVSRLDLTV